MHAWLLGCPVMDASGWRALLGCLSKRSAHACRLKAGRSGLLGASSWWSPGLQGATAKVLYVAFHGTLYVHAVYWHEDALIEHLGYRTLLVIQV